MNKVIKVAEFGVRLATRNRYQLGGKYSGEEFRETHLSDLHRSDWWDDPRETITLDFKGVRIVSPTWADEVFGYFMTADIDPVKVFQKIRLINLSDVKRETIEHEITSSIKYMRQREGLD